MDNPFGCTGCPARVQDEERIFCIHHFCRAIGGHIFDHFIEIDLHLAVDLDRAPELPPQDDEMFDHRGIDDRFFNDMLERDGLAPADCHICGDHDFCTGPDNPLVERRRPVPPEYNAVDGPDPGAGKHRDDLFGNHRHVDTDPVAFVNAEFLQPVCKPAHFPVRAGGT